MEQVAINRAGATALPPSESWRAQALLNGHIASIDAALAYWAKNREVLLPATYECKRLDLINARNVCTKALWECDHSPKNVLGHFGDNGVGPRMMDLCESVDTMVSLARANGRYVPPALRVEAR